MFNEKNTQVNDSTISIQEDDDGKTFVFPYFSYIIVKFYYNLKTSIVFLC